MDGSESLTSNDMRQRIADLEDDLRNAQAAKVEAEKNAHKKAHRAHHVRFSFNSSNTSPTSRKMILYLDADF